MTMPPRERRLDGRRRRRVAAAVGAAAVVLVVALVAGGLALFGGGDDDGPASVGRARSSPGSTTTSARTRDHLAAHRRARRGRDGPGTGPPRRSMSTAATRWAPARHVRRLVAQHVAERVVRRRADPHAAHRVLVSGRGRDGQRHGGRATPDRAHGPYPLVLFAHGYDGHARLLRAAARAVGGRGLRGRGADVPDPQRLRRRRQPRRLREDVRRCVVRHHAGARAGERRAARGHGRSRPHRRRRSLRR